MCSAERSRLATASCKPRTGHFPCPHRPHCGCSRVIPCVPALPAPTPTPAPAQAPETNAISGKATVAKPKKATFRFSSPTPGATFECRLDKGRWKACSSPHKVATKKLKKGKHTLRVRAVLGGLVDATPSKKSFKVKGRS